MLFLHAADILLNGLPHLPALGVPEHHTGGLFLSVEQIKFLAELTVIALLRLFDAEQVILQTLLVCPAGTIDTLQHLVFGIAAPVSTRQLGEFKHLQLTGAGHMGPTTQVDKVTLLVKRQVFVGWNALDDLHLVTLALLAEELNGSIPGHD